MSADKIISDWKNKNFKPVYWLEGEEPYFIDKIVDFAEHHLLPESEASFNLTVFYGRDADWTAIVNACRRYPMFAERQVVLLKEAQHMKDIDKLEGYIASPLTSTLFVVALKDKKHDGRTKFGQMLKTKAEIFSTKKLYDNKLPEWTLDMVRSHGFDIKPAALNLLIDNIGNDLSRLQNEVEKVCINLAGSKLITENEIERFVGISKEFNVFELQSAVARKDLAKAIRIVQYFDANPKAAPIQLLLPAMYGFYSKVYTIFTMPDRSDFTVKTLFNHNPSASADASAAITNFGQQGVEKILLLLHDYNLRSIGINDFGTNSADLLKEMVVKMIS